MQTEVQTTAQTVFQELLSETEDELIEAFRFPEANQECIREILESRRKIITAMQS